MADVEVRPGAYLLRIAPEARRALTDRLPQSVACAAYRFITGPLLMQPYEVGLPLCDSLSGMWCAQRGTYRVRYTADESTGTVDVLDIAPRTVLHLV
ncbi:type II toxin-antitoxin system RelE family toxin [Uniformispora flossi]|uniref:type II toxin-antitoxin system RelE family toxin n=1 Tax=Uniformispora flossi TaxID=3390723 RepID=UPI003C2BA85F